MRAASRGSSRVGTSRRYTLALEERLPLLLVVPADELDAGQLAAPDEVRELPFVVGLDPAPRLHVIDGRRGRRRRRRPLGQHFGGDGGRGLRGGRGFSASEPDRDRPASAASSTASSSVFLKRRSGSFWRQRETSASSGGGTSPRRRRKRLRLPLDHRGQHLGRRVAAEGRTPGGHLVQDQAQRELVGPMVDRPSARLLGRHVFERAQRACPPACPGATASRACRRGRRGERPRAWPGRSRGSSAARPA